MKRDLENAETTGNTEKSYGLGPSALRIDVRLREVAQDAPVAGAHGARRLKFPKWLVELLVLGAVLGISAAFASLRIGKGWVPADDGTLAQSALRVLQGQLPHRDFTEIYTGGLSFIHALAFRAFGVNLMSLRICVFLFFLAWLPAVYYVAHRFTSALTSGLITLLAVAWSYPNYPAAMPSWYNLFFATYGAAALLHYIEVRKSQWLIIAGICGGVSILIKVIGTYYVAGVLLFLAFLEQDEHDSSCPGHGAVVYRVFNTSCLVLFFATVIYFFRGRLGNGELFQFVLPALALVGVIVVLEGWVQTPGTRARFGVLCRLVGPFVSGVLAPIILFLVPYARSGALGAFFSGVASSAVARSVGLGLIRPAGVEVSIYGLVLLGLLAAAMFMREFQNKVVGTSIALGLALMLYLSTPMILSGVWFSVATVTPLLVLAGIALVVVSKKSKESPGTSKLPRQRVMLLISLAALCSFVQFPFAAPIYLSYCLPLTLLAAVAIVTTARKERGTYVLASVIGFYLLFGMVRVVPGYIYELTHTVGPMEELQLAPAGGLQIESAARLEQFIHFLQQHSPNGLLYAGNDCPSFYFLSGLKNVTRDDGGTSPQEVLRALGSTDLKVVVINEVPFFPGAQMSPVVRAEVMRKFPESRLVEIVHMGLYRVFWRP